MIEWFAGRDEQVTTSDRELAEMLAWRAEQRFFARSAAGRRRLLAEIEERLGGTPAGREGEAARNKSVAGKHLPSPFVVRRSWAWTLGEVLGVLLLLLGLAILGSLLVVAWILRQLRRALGS